MKEQLLKIKTSKSFNCSSEKPAKDRDYETFKVNIRERSKSFNRKCCTPIVRVTNVRQSLLKIKVNTVANIINLFNKPKKSMSVDESPMNEKINSKFKVERTRSHNEKESSSKNRSEKLNQSQIENYITFYNELSSIKQTSVDSDSKMNSEDNMELDSGSNKNTTRQRSQSCNVATIRKPVNILERYKKYPNFKLSYLKYFGVDSREYLSMHGVDVTKITDLMDEPRGLTLSSSEDVECVNNIDHMRKRSKSFSAKTLSDPITYPNYPNFKPSYLKYFGVGVNGIDVDRKKKFWYTTEANRPSKSSRMVNMEANSLDTLPAEAQPVKIPLGNTAMESDQISALHKSDVQENNGLYKRGAKKANMDCVKILSAKFTVEKKQRM